MIKERIQALHEALRRGWLPLCVLIFGLSITGAAFYKYEEMIQATAFATTFEESKEYQRTLEQGIDSFLNFNRNVAAFFAASKKVTYTEFSSYMQSVDLGKNYPAAHIVGYVPRIAKASAADFEIATRRIFPDYKLRSSGPNEDYIYPLLYHYPKQELSGSISGYDYSTISERHKAMQLAQDLGVTIVSKPHATVIDPHKRPGVAMFTPIYDPKLPTSTITERQIALNGFVVSIFVIDDLIKEIMGSRFRTRFDLEIFQSHRNDRHTISKEDLIYDEDGESHALEYDDHPLINISTVEFGNQSWSLHFFLKTANHQHNPFKSAMIILPSGLLVSIAMALLASKMQQAIRIKHAIKDRSKQFDSVFENHATGVYSLDLERRIINANARLLNDLEMSKDDIIGSPVEKLVDPEYVAYTLKNYQEALHGQAVAYDNVVITRTGKRIHLSIALIPISIEGKITSLLAIAKNITAREAADRETRESRKMLQLVIDNIPQRVFWKNTELVYIGCNRKVCEDAGLNSPDDIVGKTDYDLPWAAQAEHYRLKDHETMDSGVATINHEEPHPRPDGTQQWIRVSKIPLTDDNGKAIGILGVAEDITEQKALEQQLLQMAHYDSLTSLPNRAYFYNELEKAISRSIRHNSLIAFMYFDIDKFKFINDTYGHDIGDAVIVAFGQRVKSVIREVDTLGRLGGDEFALIVENLSSAEDANIVANKIITAMQRPLMAGELTLRISTSIGVAFYKPGMASDDLVRAADQAMYKAKQSGRNRYEVADHEPQVHTT